MFIILQILRVDWDKVLKDMKKNKEAEDQSGQDIAMEEVVVEEVINISPYFVTACEKIHNFRLAF